MVRGKINLRLLIAFLLILLTLPSLSLAQSEGESYYYWAQPTCVYPVVKVEGKIPYIDYSWSACDNTALRSLSYGTNARIAYFDDKRANPDIVVGNYLLYDQPLRFDVPGGYLEGYLVYFTYAGGFEPRRHIPPSGFGLYINVAVVPKDAIGQMTVKPMPTPRPLVEELPPGFSWVVAGPLDTGKKTNNWIEEVAKRIAQQSNRSYEEVLTEIQLINGNGYIPGSFANYTIGLRTKIAVKAQDAAWPQAPQPRPYTEGDIYDVYAPIQILDEVPRYYFICQDGCEKGKTWNGYRYAWTDNPPKIRELTEMEKAFVRYVRNNLTFRYWNGETMRIPLTEELLQIGFSIQESSGYPWQAWLAVLWTESPKFVDATSYAGAQGLNQMLSSTFELFTHQPKADIWNHWDNSFSAANDQIDLGLGVIPEDLWICRFATTGCGSPRVWNFHPQQARTAHRFMVLIGQEWQKFQADWYAGRRG